MTARRPPWHSYGRSPLRLAVPRGERPTARSRALALPTADAMEVQAKAQRHAERERLGEQKATVGLAQGRRSDLVPKENQVRKGTLAEAGIDKHLAERERLGAALAVGLRQLDSVSADDRQMTREEPA